MEKYSKHFLLDCEEAKKYTVDHIHYFDSVDTLEATEIGDGNINYVFKVVDKATHKSIVLKQADVLLRSSGRPLDVYRNKIEAEILKWEGELAPGMVPEVFHYDETMCILAMEDISAYKNMRKEIMAGKVFPDFAEEISDFLVKTLLPTTDLVLDRHEKKKKVKLFTNIELCDITEDLVLTEPYYNYKNQNIVFPGNEKFVEEFLYKDEELQACVGNLRNNYMNNAQALLHGDLHSGSIFVNENGMKVIDPEFAFYGPMGYDIGNVIGNLFFSYAYMVYEKDNAKETISWIKKTIASIVNLTMEKMSKAYDELVKLPLYTAKEFKEDYLNSILADSLGYAGTEMIRRTIGDSKVIEVTSVTNPEKRIPLARALMKMGIYLIKERFNIKDGSEIVKQFELIIS